jgi:hypothetical protein
LSSWYIIVKSLGSDTHTHTHTSELFVSSKTI